MQKQGWLGQDLVAGMKKRVKDMGCSFCLFTYICEISEMVTLARVFFLGEGEDKESKKDVVLNTFTLVLQYILPGFSSCRRNKSSQDSITAGGEDVGQHPHQATSLAFSKQLAPSGLYVSVGHMRLEA